MLFRSFQVDFGLVMNPAPHPDLVILPLCEDRVSFYASDSGLRNILIFDPALAQSQALIRKLGKIPFEKFLHSSSLELIAELASKGCGTAILPERIAKLHPPLSLLNRNFPFVRDQLCLIYRSDRHQSAGARMIIKEIREALSTKQKA